MALKSSIGKIYLLLASCIPKKEDYAKNVKIYSILEMDEYRQLCTYSSVKSWLEINYSFDKLIALSIDELDIIISNLPLMLEIIDNLIIAVQFGNGWNLKKTDEPNLLIESSLKILLSKIDIINLVPNNCNISEDEIFMIFNDETIKINSELTEKMISLGRKYCIKQ